MKRLPMDGAKRAFEESMRMLAGGYGGTKRGQRAIKRERRHRQYRANERIKNRSTLQRMGLSGNVYDPCGKNYEVA